MKCEYCNNEIPAGSAKCPACGASAPVQATPPAAAPQYAPPPQYAQPPQYAPPPYAAAPQVVYVQQQPQVSTVSTVSRAVYIILGIVFCGLGIHNFYAGRHGAGAVQLLISILSCGLGWFLSALWTIIELCVVDTDGRGLKMC